MPGGVEMYVARHRVHVIKRMPDTGKAHHPSCPSFEPDAMLSGLGELMGEAVLEPEPGQVELRVRFPWTRLLGPSGTRAEPAGGGTVAEPRRRMSLRAVMHYVFERAGFNRWTPAMEGRRNQAVLRKYLLEAASGVVVKGVSLTERLYVPEPFSEATKAEAAQRRREKLAVLQPRDGHVPLALVIGEFKSCEPAASGHRLWIRHMPDAPLLLSDATWRKLQRVAAPLFEARDADSAHRVRLALCALIRAKREFTYEIEAASLMLVTAQWIPVEGVCELPLLDALVEARRRFIKPLAYDAPHAAAFPNALLLDAGAAALPLHAVSPFLDERDRARKERAIAQAGPGAWAWHTDQPMPPLPPARP